MGLIPVVLALDLHYPRTYYELKQEKELNKELSNSSAKHLYNKTTG